MPKIQTYPMENELSFVQQAIHHHKKFPNSYIKQEECEKPLLYDPSFLEVEIKKEDLEYSTNIDTNCKVSVKQDVITTPQLQQEAKISHKCPYCFYMAVDKKDLKVHYIIKHKKKYNVQQDLNIKVFTCPYCIFTAVSSSVLSRHVNLKHKLKLCQRQVHCIHCDFKAVSKTTLVNHMKCYHKDKLARCDYCKFEAINLKMLNGHLLSKHRKEIIERAKNTNLPKTEDEGNLKKMNENLAEFENPTSSINSTKIMERHDNKSIKLLNTNCHSLQSHDNGSQSVGESAIGKSCQMKDEVVQLSRRMDALEDRMQSMCDLVGCLIKSICHSDVELLNCDIKKKLQNLVSTIDNKKFDCN